MCQIIRFCIQTPIMISFIKRQVYAAGFFMRLFDMNCHNIGCKPDELYFGNWDGHACNNILQSNKLCKILS